MVLGAIQRFCMASLVTVAILSLAAGAVGVRAEPIQEKGKLSLNCIPGAHFHLEGFAGRRVKANVDRWLTVVPGNNPGLLDMFARRDAGGEPDLVPWAGEFVGKYLISGVQALRMSDDPNLKEILQSVVDRLCQLQADDGYLGPWPKAARLRGHWDLWGHYHVMLGLMMWQEHTGDKQAAAAAQRIADLVCNTCLDTNFRVVQAGSPEMNMGIIHSMARLYRKTGNPRYLRMAEEVLKDFQQAGDYYRTGLAGREYFRTPRPRWESLHSLQGLVELYRITGDPGYRQAFLHHWASIRRFDLRNTGGFSSGEAATGNPYRPDAIETCCVIAWQAVMLDALKLTGDSTIADDLESATFNAVFGSQHPSGAWCTYSTPINGSREPSHVQINFQARPDAPYLNCCSVNGPRGYGMISEWGVMQSDDTLVLNYYGPMRADVKMADGTPIAIQQQTNYPIDGTVKIKLRLPAARRLTLAIRIPHWSAKTEVLVGGQAVSDVKPGQYVKLARQWQDGDEVTLRLDTGLRYEAGDLDQYGKAAIYRGPILLCSDSRFNKPRTPTIDVARLAAARLVPPSDEVSKAAGEYEPWLVVDVRAADGSTARLIDFASAGATTIAGKALSQYVSWLPATGLRPPRPAAWLPVDGAKIGPGSIRFTWRAPAPHPSEERQYEVLIAESARFDPVVFRANGDSDAALVVPADQVKKFSKGRPYYWKLIARNKHGVTESIAPYKQFTIDPMAPPVSDLPIGTRVSDKMVTEVPLSGDVKPSYGTLREAKGWRAAPGPGGNANGAIILDGKIGMVKYTVLKFPKEDYSLYLNISPHGR
jgi:DUF1680 family protein